MISDELIFDLLFICLKSYCKPGNENCISLFVFPGCSIWMIFVDESLTWSPPVIILFLVSCCGCLTIVALFFDNGRPNKPRNNADRLFVFDGIFVDCAALLNEVRIWGDRCCGINKLKYERLSYEEINWYDEKNKVEVIHTKEDTFVISKDDESVDGTSSSSSSMLNVTLLKEQVRTIHYYQKHTLS